MEKQAVKQKRAATHIYAIIESPNKETLVVKHKGKRDLKKFFKETPLPQGSKVTVVRGRLLQIEEQTVLKFI